MNTQPPFPDKMTFKEILTNMFNVDFMSSEELQTICDAGEMYANGCVKNVQHPSLQGLLKQIEQMSDCGSPELTIVRMKELATKTLSLSTSESKREGVKESDKITLFYKYADSADGYGGKCLSLEKYLKLLKSLPSSSTVSKEEAQGEWISVKDRLPEEGGRYWCYVRDINSLGKSHFQWNCSYHEIEKRFSDRYLTNGEKVTHWQSLPSPPTN